MKGALIFRINLENKADSFAKVSNFISKLNAKEIMSSSDVRGVLSLSYSNNKSDFASVARYAFRKQDSFKEINKPERLGIAEDYDVYYCIWIKEDAVRDVVDFQYDYLIKKFFSNKKIFSILIGSDDMYFKASHYLYSMSSEDDAWYNSVFYWKQDDSLIRLQRKNIIRFNDFMPFQYFSKEKNSIRRNMKEVVEKRDFLKAIHDKKYELDMISPILRGSIGILRKLFKALDQETVEKISDYLLGGDVFTFLLFCYACLNNNRWKEISYNEIIVCYDKIQEFSISCEQLMENVVNHSSAKAGGVSIRFHEGKSEYLSRRYSLPKDYNKYIEILITDYAGNNIGGNIAQNFLNKISDEEQKFLQGLTPIDFFVDLDNSNEKSIDMAKRLNRYNISPEHIGQHIGLRVFKKIVEENNGQFGFYSHKEHEISSGENYNYREYTKMGMPGTGYTVLFPIDFYQISLKQQTQISIDVNIDLESNIHDYVEGYICSEENLCNGLTVFESQNEKEAAIIDLAKAFRIERVEKGKKCIKYISAKGMNNNFAEYICKGLIIASFDQSIPDYVFYNCSKSFVNAFLKTLAVYWENNDFMEWYKKNEFVIALYTEIPVTSCFVILGNREKTIWANKVNCYSESEYANEEWLVGEKSLNTRGTEHWKEIPPYDILHITKQDKSTIFEKYATQVLENDIQEQSFGCKLSDTHMRLGSTIHIDTFYEAELLFSNRLFANRFAYLLVNDIIKNQIFADSDKITLYSYALYSESLVVEMVDLLTALYEDKDIDYVILERESEVRGAEHIDRIRYGKSFESEQARKEYFKDRKLICIVPINSTMKTHEKLLSLFVEKNGEVCEKNIILNYALVLIGSKEPNRYWIIDKEKKSFKKLSLKIQPIPKYFIEVLVDYYEANDCELCFPPKPLDEVPLIEVNAASTIPNQSFRLGQDVEDVEVKYEWLRSEEKKLEELKDVLLYKHTVRGENHFLYYFKTDQLFIKQKDSIVTWLRQIAQKLKLNTRDYHILFCPAHYSNAGFVENVNRIVFRDAALLIRVDIDKEYRSNVRAKYSNVAKLIEILEKSITTDRTIRIYYVDDSIITGRTFYRAKSLVSSIVQQYKERSNKIDIHVFEKIFVLLDRNSNQSRLQYIGCWDSANKSEKQIEDNFFCYKTLNIPSMRSHGDSCILCKLEREAELLYSTSSTQNMIDYWKMQQKKFSISKLRDHLEDVDGETIEGNKDKSFRRMICYHLAETTLLKGKQSNKKEEVIEKILRLLIVDYNGRRDESGNEVAVEYFLSYLKILSRPFIVFDKTVKEAIFDIQLVLSEAILSKKETKEILQETKNKKYLIKQKALWEELIDDIVREQFTKRNQEDLLKLLMKQLTEMKSNFFIRIENIKKLSLYAQSIDSEKDRDLFYERFLQQTKKLLGLSSDTSKSAWFSRQISGHENELGLSRDVLGRVILENTRAYYDGIKRLNSIGTSDVNEEVAKPQYRDFCSVLKDLRYIGDDKNLTKRGAEVVKASISLLKICNDDIATQGRKLSERKIEELCDRIVRLIQQILGADRVQLLLECPLECNLWVDRLKNQYNQIVKRTLKNETDSAAGDELLLPLINEKEYSVIASSKSKSDRTIENAEIAIVKRINMYYQAKNDLKLEGVYVNEQDKFMVWEIGNTKHQLGDSRKLLIYVEFPEVSLPTDWHKIRNLLCMNYEMHKSVFNNEVINYLFELLLADKRRMLNEREKAHSHTTEKVRIAQCEWVRMNENQSVHRSFVLTLLSDLMVSEVYRNSLKDEYYNQDADFQSCSLNDVLASTFEGKNALIEVLDSTHVNRCNCLQVEFLKEDSFFEDDSAMNLEDSLIAYAVANGKNEIFLLIMALIMNAGVAGRGKKEIIEKEQKERIKVYVSKTCDGNLRIANKSSVTEQQIEIINEELHYPPQKNQGISLWSVSRYIKGILSIIIKHKLDSVDIKWEEYESKRVKNELLKLKQWMEKYLSNEYDISVCRRTRISEENQEVFFCIDIPLYAEKYPDALFKEDKK